LLDLQIVYCSSTAILTVQRRTNSCRVQDEAPSSEEIFISRATSSPVPDADSARHSQRRREAEIQTWISLDPTFNVEGKQPGLFVILFFIFSAS